MNDQDLPQARTAVEDILNVLGVARVVYVDDTIGKGVSVEAVIAAAQNLDATLLLPAFPELGDPIPADMDVLTTKIRNVWRRLDPNVQTMRGQAVVVAARRHDGNETDDVADVTILSQLIPEKQLVSLSPTHWEEQKDQLLQDSRGQRTLFLFDRDFSPIGGDSEGGIKIIASLLRNDTEGLICGLLTHHVTPETQSQQWEELSKEHDIPKDRFVVIPKRHLSQAPILFAQALKFAALSPHFNEMKSKTKEIIAEAAVVAAKQVDEVNIYDLDHIVFHVSADEGLWEPDMLFRLHAMFHRLESRRLAHVGGALEVIAAKLRAVSGIPTRCDLFPPPQSAWALQRKELYEHDGHINKNYLPLELGDIFERVDTDSTKKYILLAQPCDLMVRSKGRREPELHRIPLVEVVPENPEGKTPYSEEMPYFDPLHSKKWFVKLKAVHFVRTCILDLCVFNQDGRAQLAVNGNVPYGMRPAWKARYEILVRHWGRAVRKADMLTPMASESRAMTQAKQKIARDLNLGGLLFDDDLFKGSLAEAGGARSVTYNCKRVARLSRARAIGLLMSYTAALGRPAYDPNFGSA